MGISGHALPSYFAALMSLINFIGAFFFLPETLPKVKRGLSNKEKTFSTAIMRKIAEIPNARLYISIFALSSFGFSNLIASFALYAPRVDESIDEIKLGYYFMYAGFLLVFSQGILIRPLLKRFGEEFLVKLGAIFILIGFITIPLAPNFFWMFVTNTPILLGISFLNPALNSMLSKTTPREDQGSVMGVNQGFASLMRVIGPIIAGYLLGENNHYPFYFGAIIFAIVSLITVLKIGSTTENILILEERQNVSISD